MTATALLGARCPRRRPRRAPPRPRAATMRGTPRRADRPCRRSGCRRCRTRRRPRVATAVTEQPREAVAGEQTRRRRRGCRGAGRPAAPGPAGCAGRPRQAVNHRSTACVQARNMRVAPDRGDRVRTSRADSYRRPSFRRILRDAVPPPGGRGQGRRGPYAVVDGAGSGGLCAAAAAACSGRAAVSPAICVPDAPEQRRVGSAVLIRGGRGQSRSMIVTLAWPPPSHIVCRP